MMARPCSSRHPKPRAGLIAASTALAASVLGPFVTLTVARRQFRATVLSANRQKWIDTFRDRLAELLSLMSLAQAIKRASAAPWRGGADLFQSNAALADKLERIYLAADQIRLLTNAADPAQQALNDAISAALTDLRHDELRETELSTRIAEITDLGRDIIRRAWERVKRGV